MPLSNPTLDLFTDAAPSTPAIETHEEMSMLEKLDISKAALASLLREGKTLFVSTSFGKDSSVMTSIILSVAEELINNGEKIRTIYILNGATGLDNPLVEIYANDEIKSLKNYIAEKGLPVVFKQGRPNQSNSFLANIIGGRNTASLPGMSRKCQQQLKKAPLDKLKSTIMKIAAEERGVKKLSQSDFLDCIGSRYDESVTRRAAMNLRQESSVKPTLVEVGGTKSYLISPIADFTTMDVFEYIGNVTAGRIKTYSDFSALVQLYRDSDSGECMINQYFANKIENSTACGSRTGCWNCGASLKDQSMENMINDEGGRYDWMMPLNNIRNYLIDSHWDLSKRSWLSRTADIENGTIKIAPNTYAPSFCLELLQYCMSADADEMEATHGNPRFTTLPVEDIFYICILWNRYGYFNGMKALEVYKDIYITGNRYYPQKIKNPAPRTPIPASIVIPYCDAEYDHLMNGFRDISAATVEAEPTIEKGGRLFFDPSTGSELSIDFEGACLFLDYELDRALEQSSKYNSNPTSTIFTLMRYGIVQINKGGHKIWDSMIRVANQHKRHGLTPEDLSDPVIIKQKILKSLGVQDENAISLTALPVDQPTGSYTWAGQKTKRSMVTLEQSDMKKWENDRRYNPTYQERQLSFAM